MADRGEPVRWITVRGVHIPVYEDGSMGIGEEKTSAIDVEVKTPIDKELLQTQVDAVNEVSRDFPEIVNYLYKYDNGLKIRVEERAETGNGMVCSDDNVIVLNASSNLFKGTSLKEAADIAAKNGKKSKWGNAPIASSDIRHTSVHEFGHVIQNVIAKKNGVSRSETYDRILNNTMKRMKVNEVPKNISAYANTNKSELISECVADAYLNGNSANPFSKELYSVLKEMQ